MEDAVLNDRFSFYFYLLMNSLNKINGKNLVSSLFGFANADDVVLLEVVIGLDNVSVEKSYTKQSLMVYKGEFGILLKPLSFLDDKSLFVSIKSISLEQIVFESSVFLKQISIQFNVDIL